MHDVISYSQGSRTSPLEVRKCVAKKTLVPFFPRLELLLKDQAFIGLATTTKFNSILRTDLFSATKFSLSIAGDAGRAAALYRHAIDIDTCAEPIYRRLMRCCRRTGGVSDVADVYRLCCDALKAAGIARPSPETETLYRSLAVPGLR